jgi:hypothetical protein
LAKDILLILHLFCPADKLIIFPFSLHILQEERQFLEGGGVIFLAIQQDELVKRAKITLNISADEIAVTNRNCTFRREKKPRGIAPKNTVRS